ncbi:MAG: copper chaperone PCu(A)C [Pseudomonadota bacterium]
MKKLLMLTTAIGLGLFAHGAKAHDYSVGDLSIVHPVAFETPKAAKSGAGYMVIANDGDTDDTLVEVRADFPRVMIHNTEETDGIARMVHIDALNIPAGETVELAPGGYHVMFMGLGDDPLENGEEIQATLVFENAGEVEVVFQVVERPEDGGGHDHGDH